MLGYVLQGRRWAPRIEIVDGVPGAGKDLFTQRRSQDLSAHRSPVHRYDEAMLAMSWRHVGLNGIDEIRLALMESVLTEAERALVADADAIFIMNRFHLAFWLMNRTSGLDSRYGALVDRLQRLPVEVTLLVLERDEIEHRARHVERAASDYVWARFLDQRLITSGHASLADLYGEQQDQFLALAQSQGIPYRIEHVDVTDFIAREGSDDTSTLLV